MDRIELAIKAFIEAREELRRVNNMQAYLFSWKKPLKFYREYSKEEAISILIKEAGRETL